MTKEELLAYLLEIKEGNLRDRDGRSMKGDEEVQHIFADQALLDYINDPQITEAFSSIRKWYA